MTIIQHACGMIMPSSGSAGSSTCFAGRWPCWMGSEHIR